MAKLKYKVDFICFVYKIEILRGEMMKKIAVSNSLDENQQLFSRLLCNKHQEGVILLKDIISLSQEDTLLLCKQFTKINSTADFQKYCLCVIIGWTASFKNGQGVFFTENMRMRCLRIPQYAQGAYLNIYQDTFHEYGLDTFNSKFASIKDIETIIIKHAF
jgi:hypothetical protein